MPRNCSQKRNFPKATAQSMTVNVITGIEGMVKMLHKFGHGFLYSNIRFLNNGWENEVTMNTNQDLSSTQIVPILVRNKKFAK